MPTRDLITDFQWESTPSAQGRNHLLAIGIDKYAHQKPLHNAVRDVTAFAELLQHRYRFEAEHVHLLLNEAATRKGIWRAFRALRRQVQAHDNVIIYYAGHGSLDEVGWGYWIPVDAEPDESDEWVRNREVVDWIASLNCHHLMLISDSCFAGSFFTERLNEQSFSRKPSRWALTSGRMQAVQDGGAGEGSPFSRYLLKYLQESDHALLFSELATQVKVATDSHTEMYQTPRAEPLRIRGHEGGEFVFLPRRNEAQDWQQAREAHTQAAYQQYLKVYPEGTYVEEAHWQLATLKDNKTTYRDYLERYPAGKHADAAIQAMEQVEERTAFQRAKERGESALWAYLRKYPQGSHAPQARDELARIKREEREPEAWRLAQQSQDYGTYLKEFPDGLHADAARRLQAEQQARAEEAARLAEEAQKAKAEAEKREQADRERQAKEAQARKQAEEARKQEEAQQREQARQAKEDEKQKANASHASMSTVSEPDPRPWLSGRKKYVAAASVGGLVLILWLAWPRGENLTFEKPSLDIPQPEMVSIEGGTFTMGCTEEQQGCDEDEKPTFEATVSDFSLGKYEVTVAEFARFIQATQYQTDADKGDGSYFWTGSEWEKRAGINWRHNAEGKEHPESTFNHPVIHVSWNDALAYCNWLSVQHGYQPVYVLNGNEVSVNWQANGFRLPTEAEWEYAARGGPQRNGLMYSGSNELDQVGWYGENLNGKTHPVGEKAPNELGLHDLSGNVWEWCWDWKDTYPSGAQTDYHGPASGGPRVLRGGSWVNDAEFCRVSNRSDNHPSSRDFVIGFRLARTLTF